MTLIEPSLIYLRAACFTHPPALSHFLSVEHPSRWLSRGWLGQFAFLRRDPHILPSHRNRSSSTAKHIFFVGRDCECKFWHSGKERTNLRMPYTMSIHNTQHDPHTLAHALIYMCSVHLLIKGIEVFFNASSILNAKIPSVSAVHTPQCAMYKVTNTNKPINNRTQWSEKETNCN